MKLTAGLVVGEVSGENLACSLLQSLSTKLEQSGKFEPIEFKGILGEKLVTRGGQALFPMEKLSIIGLSEALSRIPELYLIRRKLIKELLANPPAFFLGVDAPDFNLGLEKILKRQGIPTVHYVSPTVWAWRQGRIHGIKKAVDLMLTLFPFEAKFYEQHQVPVCFTGHPLADQIDLLGENELKTKTQQARKILGLDLNKPVMALLPGSRNKEIANLSEIYLQTAKWCYKREPQLQFVVPLVKESHRAQFMALQEKIAPELPMLVLAQQNKNNNQQNNQNNKENQTQENTTSLALQACDVALVKAGTATLEVMLHKKPMIVSYRVHPITFQIVKRLIKVPWVALPNLLAEEQLVPEFLQEDMQPEIMGAALLALLEDNHRDLLLHRHAAGDKSISFAKHKEARERRVIKRADMIDKFFALHELLRRGASDRAAEAILNII